MHSPLRLKLFFGHGPPPDYETWSSNVKLFLKDTKQPDLPKSCDNLYTLWIFRNPWLYFWTVEDNDDLNLQSTLTPCKTGWGALSWSSAATNNVEYHLQEGRNMCRRFWLVTFEAVSKGLLGQQLDIWIAAELTHSFTAEWISRASCMKKHLSASKPKTYSQHQGASVLSQGECTKSLLTVASKSKIKDLKRQIADSQSQLT